MNYLAHYTRLIERAGDRKVSGYTERHHIKPKCMGGGDERENIVRLTAEEHYVAHQLLVKIHPDVRGLATATVRMAKQCVGNKAYGWLRRRHAAEMAERNRGNQHGRGRTRPTEEREAISRAMKGIPKSLETRAKMSDAQRGNSHAKGLKRPARSAEYRKKLGDAHRGKPLSPERRAKLSADRKGIPKSPETRARMREARRARAEREREAACLTT